MIPYTSFVYKLDFISNHMSIDNKVIARKKMYYLSAICKSLCGLKVPSASMYIALPSPPP